MDALRQQSEAQQILIENLQKQLLLVEERAYMVQSINEDLVQQLDALTDRVVTQKGVQTEEDFSKPETHHQACQTDQDCDEEDPEHLTPRRKAPRFILLEQQAKIDEIKRLQMRQQELKSQTLFRCKPYVMELQSRYHSVESALVETNDMDGKIVHKFQHKTVITHLSGSKREIYPDGYSVIFFENGDIRQTYPDRKTVYFFKEGRVTRTDFPNGDAVLLFESGQLEKHMRDGSKVIYFKDGSKKFIARDGSEQRAQS